MENMEFSKKVEMLQEENRRLRVAVEELSVLNDIAIAVTSTQELENIVDLIVQKCVKHLKVEQGVVMLLDEKDNQNPFRTMVRKQDTVADILPYRLDTQLTGWMLKHQTPLLVNNFHNDERFKGISETESHIRSLLSVPMLLKGKMIGLLTVFNKRSESNFTPEDQRLLAIISAQSAQVIENARLYKREQDYVRFQEEMRLAGEIQVNLLPKVEPEIPGYQIAGRSIPAKDVGGDYFDFIPIEDDRLAFCLGDVSGKGMPAAMLMANVQATLRGITSPSITSKACIERSNTLLHKSTDPQKFVTLFYGILNTQTNELCYCNAGHDNPFLLNSDGKVKRLQTGGIVLGFVPQFTFAEEKIPFQKGDLLVLYSDGITEAMNAKEEEFGEKRLEELIMAYRKESANRIIGKILETIETHVGNVPQMDDMTMVVLKRS
jgi:sigma-B regulation protein RsbU (phosphoserine phosphatase)